MSKTKETGSHNNTKKKKTLIGNKRTRMYSKRRGVETPCRLRAAVLLPDTHEEGGRTGEDVLQTKKKNTVTCGGEVSLSLSFSSDSVSDSYKCRLRATWESHVNIRTSCRAGPCNRGLEGSSSHVPVPARRYYDFHHTLDFFMFPLL